MNCNDDLNTVLDKIDSVLKSDPNYHQVLALMKYAITKSRLDNTFEGCVDKMYCVEYNKHRNRQIIDIVTNFFNVYKLVPSEIDAICSGKSEEVMTYLIDRTNKINIFGVYKTDNIEEKNITTLKALALCDINNIHQRLRLFFDQAEKFFDNCCIMHSANINNKTNAWYSHISSTVPKHAKNHNLFGQHLSIDIVSSNFSWLYCFRQDYHQPNHTYNTYDALAQHILSTYDTALTDLDHIIASSKHARQIVFNKAFKKFGLIDNYQKDCNKLLSLIMVAVFQVYPNACLISAMGDECLFNVCDLLGVKLEVHVVQGALAAVLPDYIVDKMRIEYVDIKKVEHQGITFCTRNNKKYRLNSSVAAQMAVV
jgi:hypothetical protein